MAHSKKSSSLADSVHPQRKRAPKPPYSFTHIPIDISFLLHVSTFRSLTRSFRLKSCDFHFPCQLSFALAPWNSLGRGGYAEIRVGEA